MTTITDHAVTGHRTHPSTHSSPRVRARGTAIGPLFGPASGRSVDITVVDIARVVGGRIVGHWGVPDRFALLAQTGVLDRLTGPPQTRGPRPADGAQ